MKSDVVQLGEVYFDLSTSALSFKDGRPVALRNKSKAVLTFLIERRNQTAAKSDILTGVWTDVLASDESLVQCIADIRKLIGPDARNIIETIPREGYRLNVRHGNAEKPRVPLTAVIVLATAAFVAGWLLWPERPDMTAPPAVTTQVSPGPPGTDITDAYLELLKGRASANRFSLEESLLAERHFRKAIALDSGYAQAYAELGILLAVRFENDWAVLIDPDKEKAIYYAQKAVALDPDLWLGHYALGRLHSVFADQGKAETHLRTAMSLRPDNEDPRAYLGVVLNFQGRAEMAVSVLKQAVASHPSPPFWYYFGLGHAQFNVGNFVEAERSLTTCLDLAGNSPYCLRYLIATYGLTDQIDKARIATQTYEAMGFEASVSQISNLMSFHHQEDLKTLETGLRLAGLPD